MNQVQTVIATVDPRYTSRGQVWDVVDGQGVTYTAWEPAQAQKAMALVGQQVFLSFVEKPSNNPQYGPNRSFKDAMPAAGAPALQPAPQASPLHQFSPQVAPAPPALPVGPTAKGAEPSARDEQIIRQSAYKAAVDLTAAKIRAGFYDSMVGTPSSINEEISASMRRITDELVAYGLTGSWGGAAQQQPAEQEQPTAPAAPWE